MDDEAGFSVGDWFKIKDNRTDTTLRDFSGEILQIDLVKPGVASTTSGRVPYLRIKLDSGYTVKIMKRESSKEEENV